MITSDLDFIDVPAQEIQERTQPPPQYQNPVQQTPVYQPQNLNTGMNNHQTAGEYASLLHGGFSWEPSILEELGIHNSDIKSNLRMILLPNKAQKEIGNNFIACICFFVLYAFLLLLLRKPSFGTVYTVGLFGYFALYFIFYNMRKAYYNPEEGQIDTFGWMDVFTPVSYCIPAIFPIVIFCRLFSINIITTLILAIPFLGWASYCAGRYLSQVAKVGSLELLFIPLLLFYAFLLLLPII